MSSCYLHQLPTLDDSPIRIRSNCISEHILLRQEDVVSWVNEDNPIGVVNKILMVGLVPVLYCVLEEIAPTLGTDRVQSWLVLELLFAELGWVYSFVVEEESILLCGGVINWVQIYKRGEGAFGFLREFEGTVDEYNSFDSWEKGWAWWQKRGGKVPSKAKPNYLECIFLADNIELTTIRPQPIQ